DDLEKDELLDNESYYKYVTLDALWEKEPNTPNLPEEDEVTVVSCTGGSVELELPKDGWVHLRKSTTEPIIRIYSESK
ncbi:hypothetical protein EI534_48020, partial [Pseudomonas frederiksbergensis]|nr:hypothetical protein [Pseudomonas frederiksbergensis]